MSYTLADLALARRHVEEAAERIARQRDLISRMDEAGYGTGDAWALLGLFEETAEQMRIHLVEIEAQLAAV